VVVYSVSVDEFRLSFVLLLGGVDALARKLELLMLFLISSIVKGEKVRAELSEVIQPI